MELKFDLLAIVQQLEDTPAENGFDPKYGARPLQRKIEAIVVVPIAKFLVEYPALRTRKLGIDLGSEGLELDES